MARVRLSATPRPGAPPGEEASGGARAVDRDDAPDPDAEFVAGRWDEASLQSLDFDDEAASRNLHAREPDDDFATLDDRDAASVRADAADLLDRVGWDDDDVLDDVLDEPWTDLEDGLVGGGGLD